MGSGSVYNVMVNDDDEHDKYKPDDVLHLLLIVDRFESRSSAPSSAEAEPGCLCTEAQTHRGPTRRAQSSPAACAASGADHVRV